MQSATFKRAPEPPPPKRKIDYDEPSAAKPLSSSRKMSVCCSLFVVRLIYFPDARANSASVPLAICIVPRSPRPADQFHILKPHPKLFPRRRIFRRRHQRISPIPLSALLPFPGVPPKTPWGRSLWPAIV